MVIGLGPLTKVQYDILGPFQLLSIPGGVVVVKIHTKVACSTWLKVISAAGIDTESMRRAINKSMRRME